MRTSYGRKTENYIRYRQVPPKYIQEGSYHTVPISHTKFKGTKWDKPGVKAVTGKVKKNGKWVTVVQSILVPRKGGV